MLSEVQKEGLPDRLCFLIEVYVVDSVSMESSIQMMDQRKCYRPFIRFETSAIVCTCKKMTLPIPLRCASPRLRIFLSAPSGSAEIYTSHLSLGGFKNQLLDHAAARISRTHLGFQIDFVASIAIWLTQAGHQLIFMRWIVRNQAGVNTSTTAALIRWTATMASMPKFFYVYSSLSNVLSFQYTYPPVIKYGNGFSRSSMQFGEFHVQSVPDVSTGNPRCSSHFPGVRTFRCRHGPKL